MHRHLNLSLIAFSLVLNGCAEGAKDASKLQESLEQLTIKPLYNTAPQWNTYVKNNGKSSISASNTDCTGDPSGGYYACIHGGEKRVATLTGITSCTGSSAQDAMNAFVWTCDASAKPIRILSMRLKDEKNLYRHPQWQDRWCEHFHDLVGQSDC